MSCDKIKVWKNNLISLMIDKYEAKDYMYIYDLRTYCNCNIKQEIQNLKKVLTTYQ